MIPNVSTQIVIHVQYLIIQLTCDGNDTQFSTPDCNTCAVSYSFKNYFSCYVHCMMYMYSTVLYGMFHILLAPPPLRMMGFRTTVQGDSDTFLKESDKILTSQKNFLKVPTMNKPFRFNF